MFELIFFSILSVIIVTPFGFILFNQSNNTINLSNQLIYGTIIISFIALLINFFFPLNSSSNTLILILPLFILLKNLKIYFSLNFLRFVAFNSLIIFLLVNVPIILSFFDVSSLFIILSFLFSYFFLITNHLKKS